MFTLDENKRPINRSTAVIKIIGVGGGGGNALEYMETNHIENVEFIAANTDLQVLESLNSNIQPLPLGYEATQGLGAGCNPDVGKEAALEEKTKLQEIVSDADMIFITAGMGGGTGTGAAPVIAEIARNNGCLTVGVVTKPFELEGDKRSEIALLGISELEKHVDALIVIPNEKLLTVLEPDMSLLDAFHEADKVLHGAVRGIAELITRRGIMNLDFADVKTVMKGTGKAMIGTGFAKGENRAHEAASKAISNPLLEDIDLNDVHGLLVNITGGKDVSMAEFKEIGDCMRKLAAPDANMANGIVIDEEMHDEIRVTLIATGLNGSHYEKSVDESVQEAGNDSIVSLESNRDKLKLSVETTNNGNETDSQYEQYDKPAYQRNEKEEANAPYQDVLDIPSFLRKQVD